MSLLLVPTIIVGLVVLYFIIRRGTRKRRNARWQQRRDRMKMSRSRDDKMVEGSEVAWKEFPEVPGWQFTIREVSIGVYLAIGKNKNGVSIELSGTDPDKLLDECKRVAKEKSNQQ